MGSPNNFKPPPHAYVWGISVDSAKQISGQSLSVAHLHGFPIQLFQREEKMC